MFEVTVQVWEDDLESDEPFYYSVIQCIDGNDEVLSYGTCESREDAMALAKNTLDTLF